MAQLAQPHDRQGRFARQSDPRTRRVIMRLTASEYSDVIVQAEAAGLSVSEYGRRRVLGRPVRSRTDDVMIRELRRIAGLQKHLFKETAAGLEHGRQTAEILRAIKRAIIRLGVDDTKNPK